ncbi:MAG: GerMN domain-containing protein [bacterium]
MRRALVWIIVLAVIAAVVWATQIRPVDNRVMVYFIGPANGGTTLVPVERTVRGRGVEVILRGAIEALLAGPTPDERARGLSTEIPAGTRLRELAVQEGVAIIDLTEAVGSGGGSASMLARLWQIVYTGTQHPAARQVRLLIEGTERRVLGGEGVLIDRPIGRPPAFPRF